MRPDTRRFCLKSRLCRSYLISPKVENGPIFRIVVFHFLADEAKGGPGASMDPDQEAIEHAPDYEQDHYFDDQYQAIDHEFQGTLIL